LPCREYLPVIEIGKPILILSTTIGL